MMSLRGLSVISCDALRCLCGCERGVGPWFVGCAALWEGVIEASVGGIPCVEADGEFFNGDGARGVPRFVV